MVLSTFLLGCHHQKRSVICMRCRKRLVKTNVEDGNVPPEKEIRKTATNFKLNIGTYLGFLLTRRRRRTWANDKFACPCPCFSWGVL